MSRENILTGEHKTHTKNGVYSYTPILNLMNARDQGYNVAKNKYKLKLFNAVARQTTQAEINSYYKMGFEDGWLSGDYSVQSPGKPPVFFNSPAEVSNHIFKPGKPDRFPYKKDKFGIYTDERLKPETVVKQFSFKGPTKQITTQNNKSYTVNRRIFGGNLPSPHTGLQMQPPGLPI